MGNNVKSVKAETTRFVYEFKDLHPYEGSYLFEQYMKECERAIDLGVKKESPTLESKVDALLELASDN